MKEPYCFPKPNERVMGGDNETLRGLVHLSQQIHELAVMMEIQTKQWQMRYLLELNERCKVVLDEEYLKKLRAEAGLTDKEGT